LKPLAAVLIFFSVLTSTGLAVALVLPRAGVLGGLMLIMTWALVMLFAAAILLILAETWSTFDKAIPLYS